MTNGVIIRFANGSFNVIAAMSRMKQGSLKARNSEDFKGKP